MVLSWLEAGEWRSAIERAGLEVEALYGWFDRRPYTDNEDSVWVTKRSS